MHTQKVVNYTLPFHSDKPPQSVPLLSQQRWVFTQRGWLYFMFPSGQHGGGKSLRSSVYLVQYQILSFGEELKRTKTRISCFLDDVVII